MATMQGIIDAALAEGGIDATPAQALVWANDRYRRLVGKSKWRKLERNLGPTVAGQSRYGVAADVVDVLLVRVARSAPYRPISIEELWELQSGESFRATRRGLFTVGYDDDSEAESVEIYPTPETGGDALTGLCAVLPPTLDLSGTPAIPEDFHLTGLKAGIVADGLKLIDEQHQEAAVWEAEWENAASELGRRRNSRYGKGPTAIRLVR